MQAAALPLVALTAWQALFEAGELSEGQTVLIHAAAGGVGHVAVQLAKWRRAHVIGTASGRNKDFLRELGADTFVNYRMTRFEDVVRDVDVVLEPLGGETRDRSWGVLKKGGVLVSILGPPSAQKAAAHEVRAAHIMVRPQAEQLAEVAGLVDAGKLKPVIEAVFPLEEARKAHALSEKGHTRGKIVLHATA